jgi:hypothetical protein
MCFQQKRAVNKRNAFDDNLYCFGKRGQFTGRYISFHDGAG